MNLMSVRLFWQVGRGQMKNRSWRVRKLLRFWGCLSEWFRV